jgi:hypothetical protein
MAKRVLVCGGRDYGDFGRVDLVLREIQPDMVIHGGYRGADSLANRWAAYNDVPCLRVPAKWMTHRKAAGPIRNAQMLELGQPTLVVAFPGGDGTADMVAKARAAGVPVMEVSE